MNTTQIDYSMKPLTEYSARDLPICKFLNLENGPSIFSEN